MEQDELPPCRASCTRPISKFSINQERRAAISGQSNTASGASEPRDASARGRGVNRERKTRSLVRVPIRQVQLLTLAGPCTYKHPKFTSFYIIFPLPPPSICPPSVSFVRVWVSFNARKSNEWRASPSTKTACGTERRRRRPHRPTPVQFKIARSPLRKSFGARPPLDKVRV